MPVVWQCSLALYSRYLARRCVVRAAAGCPGDAALRGMAAATQHRSDGAPRRTAARDVARFAARRGSRGDALRRALCFAATACGALSQRRAAMVTNMFL